jgi:fumarate hydratase class I
MLLSKLRPAGRLASSVFRPLSTVPFKYEAPYPLPNKPDTAYRKLEGSEKWVSTVSVEGTDYLKVAPEAITALTAEGMTDIAHLLRTAHLEQLAKILDDDEASQNDKFVALELLKNANIGAQQFIYWPYCSVRR